MYSNCDFFFIFVKIYFIKNKPKYITFYLPQFHQIPENDKWWVEGFTEWNSVRSAKPLFKGHKQPIIPGNFGYYDLLKDDEIFKKQSELALQNGIYGFAFYHYWFGNGDMLLEKPAEKLLQMKNVNMPFCFCWANQSWSKSWYGGNKELLIEQKYPGREDIKKHIEYLVPFFEDSRYIKHNGKPVFIVYAASLMDDFNMYMKLYKDILWNSYNIEIYLISGYFDRNLQQGEYISDARIGDNFNEALAAINLKLKNRILDKLDILNIRKPKKYKSNDIKEEYIKTLMKYANHIPLLVPNYDDTPRKNKEGKLFLNEGLKFFEDVLAKATELSLQRNTDDFVFIKSWNEWAEGNYLEPDSNNKIYYLEKIKEVFEKY